MRKMKCRECGEEMHLDDISYDSEGQYDNYWDCPKCQVSCIEEIRDSKPFKQLWFPENSDNAIDYIIKCD